MSDLIIRHAQGSDQDTVWALLEPVFRAGETYAIASDISREEALRYWLGEGKTTYVAELDDQILGTYYLRANQAGNGGHVCNCGYITSEAARGRGIARHMCLHSLDAARQTGYRAMQFNCVVTTNEGAIRLWHSLGFETVGRLPEAFSHPLHGDVDALVMYQRLV